MASLLIGRKAFVFKKKVDFRIVFSVFSFLFFTFLSLVFSISLPLSLEVFIKYLSTFSIFLFLYSVSLEKLDKKIILNMLFFIGGALAATSFFLLFFSDIGQKIPALNLLFATYGHNHLGTFLLLLAPLGGYIYIKEKKRLYLFLSIFFYLSLFLSFGRILIFLAVIQTLVLSIFLLNHKQIKDRAVNFIFKFIFYFGVLILGSFLIVSRLEECSSLLSKVPYQEKICKNDPGPNVRYYYWSQAILSIKENPIFGSGLGTYGLASYKFRQVPDLWSKYAHNDFLQMFSDSGIFAGLFFISITIFILKEVGFDKKEEEKYLLLIKLPLISFLIDIFFDFNFNFFSLSLSFLIISSIFLREKPTQKSISTNYVGGFLKISIFGILFISIINFITSGLILFNKSELAFNIFPHFTNQERAFIDSEELSLEQKKKLDKIYYYSPAISRDLLSLFSDQERADYEFSLWEKDPWRIEDSFLPSYYSDIYDFEGMSKSMLFISNFLNEKNDDIGFQKESLSYEVKRDWANIYISLSREEFSNLNIELAAKNLFYAHYFDSWSISKNLPFLNDLSGEDYTTEQRELFLRILEEIPSQYWGDNSYLMSNLYRLVVFEKADLYKDSEKLKLYVRKMISLDKWSAMLIEDEFANINLRNDVRKFTSIFQEVYKTMRTSFVNEEYFNRVFFEEKSVELEKILQEYIDVLNEESDPEKLLSFIEFLKDKTFGLYWMPAQRGYILMILSLQDEAKEAFSDCLELNPRNFECEHGLRSINENSLNYHRYEEVRKIIIDL